MTTTPGYESRPDERSTSSPTRRPNRWASPHAIHESRDLRDLDISQLTRDEISIFANDDDVDESRRQGRPVVEFCNVTGNRIRPSHTFGGRRTQPVRDVVLLGHGVRSLGEKDGQVSVTNGRGRPGNHPVTDDLLLYVADTQPVIPRTERRSQQFDVVVLIASLFQELPTPIEKPRCNLSVV